MKYQKLIDATHPATMDTDEAYLAESIAMELVSERYYKRDLVDLVRWLLMDGSTIVNAVNAKGSK